MKYLFLNLKRFDISPARGGVNRIAPMERWGAHIVGRIQPALSAYRDCAEFVVYLPEAHLLGAAAARVPGSAVRLGCQGVHWADTAVGGAFGAFTTGRTANAAAELGCESVLIGHCEERAKLAGILAEAGVEDAGAVNRILNKEIRAAQAAGLTVLYCIGEDERERGRWSEVLCAQLETGLDQTDTSRMVIAYEPTWSIGPGKAPASKECIAQAAGVIKEATGGMRVVYGGGLKTGNAQMLAQIPELDGGLIALTRFDGEIGFYPEEYLEIVRLYLGHAG